MTAIPDDLAEPTFPVRIHVIDVAMSWLRTNHRGEPLPATDWRFHTTLPDGSEVTFAYDDTATTIATYLADRGVATTTAGPGSSRRAQEAAVSSLAGDPGPVQGDGSTDAPGGAEGVQASIELDPAGFGHIEIAGVRVPQVASFSLTGRAGRPHTLTLGLRLNTTMVDGRVLLELDDATQRTLMAVGWLPPDDVEAGYYRLLAANNPAAALVALPTVAAQRDQARTERDQALARVEVAEKALRAGGERVLKQLGQMVQERDAALARVAELERQLTHAQDRPRVTEGGP